MTQYVINIGTFPNDGTGDPLRTAFNEINLNFDQVFAAGPVGSNVQIANNTILTTNTNGNLVLAPNGIGVVQANVNIVPNTSNIRNLGAADRRWSTLYIQYANISGAITVADLTATGNVTVGGNLSVTGNVINIGNIVTDAKTIQLANTAGTANAANGSGITVGANDAIATFLFDSANNAWATNIGVAVGGPITGTSLAVSDAIVYGNTTGINALFTGTTTTPNIVVNNISSDDSTFVTIQDGLDVQGDITAETVSVTGNITGNYFIGNGSQLTGVSNYANANAVAYGQVGWAGNIVPAASNTYSLGNSTLWWSNVWVAGNTIYIGGVPIGMSAGNVLTVDGNAVLQNNSNSTISTTGNITADYFFGNGSQLTGLSTNSISNGTSNVDIPVANGNVAINTNGTYAWTFDDTGNLTLPTNGSIVVDGGDGVIGPVSDDLVISWDNEEIRLVSVQGSIEMQADAAFRVQTNYDGANVLYNSRWEFSNNELVNISNNFGIVSEAGNLTLSGGRDGVNSGNTIISAVDLGSAVFNWTFGNDGGLYIPNNGALVGVTANNNGYINWVGNSSGDGNGYTTMQLVPDATVDSQILVLDPTSPGHIHLRAPGIGGNIEQPNANIFLGPENTNFEITAQYGNAAEARIHSAGNTWTFANDGNLNLPSQGNIVGVTANNAGHLQWIGNSSGDGAGYTTLQLIPDDTVTGGDQYVIIDPTAPGHIHIRAGGTQDNSSADLFLGGENSYFKVNAGANNEVRISANSHAWVFGADSVLTLPGEGVLRSIGDVVTLQSYNVGTGNVQSVYLGSGGGLGFFDQDIGGNWLEIFRSGAEPEIRVPVGRGNLNIQTAQGNTAFNWTFDNTGNLIVPGAISAVGNITGNYFIGNGNQLTNVNAVTVDVTDTNGLTTIYYPTFVENRANAQIARADVDLTYRTDENLLTVGNVSVTGNVTAANFFGNVANLTNSGNTFSMSSTGVLSLGDAGQTYLTMDAFGITANTQMVLSAANAASGNNSSILFDKNGGGLSIRLETNVGPSQAFWSFYAGNITFPDGSNQTTAYGNANATSLLAAFGSNSISTTGNVTANNISGNILVTGNVTGTTPNVTLIAGSYSWTFDNTGNTAFANGTITAGNISATGAVFGERLISTLSVGNEGGQVNLSLPAANTTLTTSITLDSFRDRFRVFETGGTNRGMYIDLDTSPAGGAAIGYRDIPQVSFTGNATLAASDAGKHYYSTQSTDYVLTIANNTSVGWSVGTAITIVNRGTGNMTIAQGTGVSLYLAGNSTAGNRTVTTYGMATLLNVAANVWMINGTGVS